MKFTIRFLMAMLPLASLAQSQSGAAQACPSIAIPKTRSLVHSDSTGYYLCASHGLIPARDSATANLYLDGIREFHWLASRFGLVFVQFSQKSTTVLF